MPTIHVLVGDHGPKKAAFIAADDVIAIVISITAHFSPMKISIEILEFYLDSNTKRLLPIGNKQISRLLNRPLFLIISSF